jgi:poly-gamma-glutamate capsule biosynthesis protein CapA/YwtB (metallophosphatase superfamily)
MVRIALTGDVMVGRLVDQYVIQNRSVRPEALWGDVLPIMLAADCRLTNLECVISDRGEEWHPTTKAFHFRGRPRTIDFLSAAKVNGVTLANNHVLDYGPEALLDCFTLLDQAGIKRTGAGATIEEALAPLVLDLPEGRVAVVALTDNEPEWEATKTKPGVNYVAYSDRGLKEPYRSRLTQALLSARRQADLVIVSAHVGPNWGAPSKDIQALAHDLINMGADLYWGHSNHTPQGIECYKGKAILYSTGDFIDDYMIDKDERNDLSFLFMLELEGGRVERIRLHPTCIEDLGVRLANEQERGFLVRTMQAKCKAFGTAMSVEGQVGTITVN